MINWRTQLSLMLLAFLVGCTDGRQPPSYAPKSVQNMPPTSQLVPAGEIQFDSQATDALQMTVSGQFLYLTGRPFGLSVWGIANQESPTLVTAASDRIQAFAPSGSWIVDSFASGALALLGNFIFTSGTKGLSAIDMSQMSAPVEAERLPPAVTDPTAVSTSVSQDNGYVFSAMAPHPTLPILYGFQRTNFLLTLSVSSGGVGIGTKTAYGSGNVCCAMGAATFQQAVFGAFQDHAGYYVVDPQSGSITQTGSFQDLQVVNVAATSRYLYFQHEPAYGGNGGRNFPRGVYVFDVNGQNVAYFQMDNAVRFAVSSDDTHIYANFDNTSIQVLRMMWTNNQ